MTRKQRIKVLMDFLLNTRFIITNKEHIELKIDNEKKFNAWVKKNKVKL